MFYPSFVEYIELFLCGIYIWVLSFFVKNLFIFCQDLFKMSSVNSNRERCSNIFRYSIAKT